MMPVRDMVIFPQQMTPFIVGREASVRALEEALAGDKKIFLSTQHDASVDDPKPEEIYAVGTLANIVQSVKLPDGNIKVLVEGVERARAISIASEEGFFRATVRLYLDGKLRQWFQRSDGKGVVFILPATTVADAQAIMTSLPLAQANLVEHEYVALSPLGPLAALLGPTPDK